MALLHLKLVHRSADVESQERGWLAGLVWSGASLWLAVPPGPYRMKKRKKRWGRWWYQSRRERILSRKKQRRPQRFWAPGPLYPGLLLDFHFGAITSSAPSTLGGLSSGDSSSLQLSLSEGHPGGTNCPPLCCSRVPKTSLLFQPLTHSLLCPLGLAWSLFILAINRVLGS